MNPSIHASYCCLEVCSTSAIFKKYKHKVTFALAENFLQCSWVHNLDVVKNNYALCRHPPPGMSRGKNFRLKKPRGAQRTPPPPASLRVLKLFQRVLKFALLQNNIIIFSIKTRLKFCFHGFVFRQTLFWNKLVSLSKQTGNW